MGQSHLVRTVQLDHFLSTFGKKCICPFENPKTLRKISKNWCWKCKMSCKLLQMLVIPHGRTIQNDGRHTLNVCQGPKGGLRSEKRHRRLGRMSIYANIRLFPNFFYMYTNIRWHFCLRHYRRETFVKFWDFLNYFEKMIIYLCNRSWKVNAKLACILYENEIKAIILIMIYHF